MSFIVFIKEFVGKFHFSKLVEWNLLIIQRNTQNISHCNVALSRYMLVDNEHHPYFHAFPFISLPSIRKLHREREGPAICLSRVPIVHDGVYRNAVAILLRF